MEELDESDLAILKILQARNTTSQVDIAEQINLSPAAVQRRIKRLRASNVIVADVSIVNPEKLGGLVTLIVEVSLNRESIDLIDATRRVFEAEPEVQQCYYVTGDCDFVLIITTASMQSYEKLTRRLFFSNDNVLKFKTTVAMNTIKAGMTLPIDCLWSKK